VAISLDGTLFVSSYTNGQVTTFIQDQGQYKVESIIGSGYRTDEDKLGESTFIRPMGLAIHEESNSCYVAEEGGAILKITFLQSPHADVN